MMYFIIIRIVPSILLKGQVLPFVNSACFNSVYFVYVLRYLFVTSTDLSCHMYGFAIRRTTKFSWQRLPLLHRYRYYAGTTHRYYAERLWIKSYGVYYVYDYLCKYASFYENPQMKTFFIILFFLYTTLYPLRNTPLGTDYSTVIEL